MSTLLYFFHMVGRVPSLTPFLPFSSPYPLIPRGGEVISLIGKFGTNNLLTVGTASPFSS